MPEYVAYNKLHYKNRPVGRSYPVAWANTRSAAINKANRANASYNRLGVVKNAGYKVKVVGARKR